MAPITVTSGEEPVARKNSSALVPRASSLILVGLGGFEPPTSPLSGVRSNQLSYRPKLATVDQAICVSACETWLCSLLKEVIQPQVPLRLPCYDFTPVMNHTVVTALRVNPVRLATSGATHSHGVTGGVYKARERIHRDIADSRLLAIPTSCTRVAECNPD